MTDSERIFEAVATTFKVDVNELSEETLMKEDLNVKSSQYFTIIAVVEELAGKKVTYAQIRKCKTIGEIIQFAEKLKEE